jgi:3-hydroxyacyl-CoA dehydrogenase/enoyl-CoA hydratase/carnithine racemase
MRDTVFDLQRVETRAGAVALVTLRSGDERPTVLGRSSLRSAAQVVARLETGDWVALVLTGKPSVFCAGADLDEFPKTTTRAAAVEGSRAGHELFGRIRALPFPTVAAVNGACLGGGLELALHCDARTISADARHVGCPEVFLGLIPGWGGTQLVPRLLGPEKAVALIVSNPLRQNRLLDARGAFELGLADRLVEPDELVDASIAYALEIAADGEVARASPDFSELETVISSARASVDDAVHGAAPAPYRALELIAGAAVWTLEEGYLAEEEAAAALVPGPQAQASFYAFNLIERRAKKGVGLPDSEPRPLGKVGIVGAGLMATQLATLVLRRLQVPVVLRDVDDQIVSRALAQIREELDGAAARGRLTTEQADSLTRALAGSTSYDGFEDCDLVLEAVVEQLAVKRQVFFELRELVRPTCVLATNTSSLSVSEMGADVGLHFFNPVALLPLVELVKTANADTTVLATGAAFARGLGKRPVLVADAPAFVVNRLLARLLRVVLDALEHGNTVEEADEAILRLGLPLAPSVLLQLVGPRVANQVLLTLHAAYPERFPLSPILARYADGEQQVLELVVPDERRRTPEEIREAALEALADEARHVLEDGVVSSAADIDTCLILGAGFPFFLGGITRHLDQTGISERVLGRPLAELGAAHA